MHRTRNAAYGQPYRGFESLPLRHTLLKLNDIFLNKLANPRPDHREGGNRRRTRISHLFNTFQLPASYGRAQDWCTAFVADSDLDERITTQQKKLSLVS